MYDSPATMEIRMLVFQETKNRSTIWPGYFTPGYLLTLYWQAEQLYLQIQ